MFVFSACVNVYQAIDKGSLKLYLCLRKLYANLKYSPHLSLVSSVIDGADVLFERMEQCLKKIRYEEKKCIVILAYDGCLGGNVGTVCGLIEVC